MRKKDSKSVYFHSQLLRCRVVRLVWLVQSHNNIIRNWENNSCFWIDILICNHQSLESISNSSEIRTSTFWPEGERVYHRLSSSEFLIIIKTSSFFHTVVASTHRKQLKAEEYKLLMKCKICILCKFIYLNKTTIFKFLTSRLCALINK